MANGNIFTVRRVRPVSFSSVTPLDRKPRVKVGKEGLEVEAVDHILNRSLLIKPDLVSLATAIVPYRDEQLAQLFKVPVNEDGFFVEAHAKLGPSDLQRTVSFFAALAHYPKPSMSRWRRPSPRPPAPSRFWPGRESRSAHHRPGQSRLVQQLRRLHRCMSLLGPILPGRRAFSEKPSSTPSCARDAALCVASCRSGALNLKGFGEEQIMAMINQI